VKYLYWTFAALAALGSPAWAQITNYETADSLKATRDLECLSVDQVQNVYTPPDLMAAVVKCGKAKRYEDAFFLFLTVHVFSYFDAQRVPDPSAQGAFPALVLKYRPDQETVAYMKEGYKRLGAPNSPEQAKICANMVRIGPPSYRPEYITGFGMGHVVGVDETLLSPETQKNWDKTLAYLGCTPPKK